MARKNENKPKPSRLASKLTKPIVPVRGSLVDAPPKPTKIPVDWRIYCPAPLQAKTEVIILEMVRKFPMQGQIVPLCRRFIFEMTPYLIDSVLEKTIPAFRALDDSYMGGLIESWVGFNSDSAEAFAIEQEVKKSDEWMNLAREISRAEKHPSAATKTANQNSRRVLIWKNILENPMGSITNEEAAIYFGVKQKTIRAWVNREVESRELTRAARRGSVTSQSVLDLEKNLRSKSEE